MTAWWCQRVDEPMSRNTFVLGRQTGGWDAGNTACAAGLAVGEQCAHTHLQKVVNIVG